MSDSVRPFTVAIPDSDLDDLHARLRNTRWGDAEVVDDWSQGIPLEYVRDVATYSERPTDGIPQRNIDPRNPEQP